MKVILVFMFIGYVMFFASVSVLHFCVDYFTLNGQCDGWIGNRRVWKCLCCGIGGLGMGSGMWMNIWRVISVWYQVCFSKACLVHMRVETAVVEWDIRWCRVLTGLFLCLVGMQWWKMFELLFFLLFFLTSLLRFQKYLELNKSSVLSLGSHSNFHSEHQKRTENCETWKLYCVKMILTIRIILVLFIQEKYA